MIKIGNIIPALCLGEELDCMVVDFFGSSDDIAFFNQMLPHRFTLTIPSLTTFVCERINSKRFRIKVAFRTDEELQPRVTIRNMIFAGGIMKESMVAFQMNQYVTIDQE